MPMQLSWQIVGSHVPLESHSNFSVIIATQCMPQVSKYIDRVETKIQNYSIPLGRGISGVVYLQAAIKSSETEGMISIVRE